MEREMERERELEREMEREMSEASINLLLISLKNGRPDAETCDIAAELIERMIGNIPAFEPRPVGCSDYSMGFWRKSQVVAEGYQQILDEVMEKYHAGV